jgi:pimeloyl-ACP methyl ester carboxylesterase
MLGMTIFRQCFISLQFLIASLLPYTASSAKASTHAVETTPCFLVGVSNSARCGHIQRPLDPDRPDAAKIEIHFAVLPALARHKRADPVFFFAGGPGQSAIDLAAPMSRLLARLGNRRDVVLIDQRGTGRSAPLKCTDDRSQQLGESADTGRQLNRLRDCRSALEKLAWGDLKQFTTTIAVADADAVREAIGAPQVNLIGASYGTRAVLEYQRQFPLRVRRAVIDGVAPPDMALPASFSVDSQTALDGVLAGCADDPVCTARFPRLRDQLHKLLASLPLHAIVTDPVSGKEESIALNRDTLLAWIRAPLYSPTLTSALPQAIADAAQGRFNGLVALASALSVGGEGMATGMHFSVVCSEDMAAKVTSMPGPGADFGATFGDFYRRVCAEWPRGKIPAAFYRLQVAVSATLVLSGGADPATPPRHGERVARELGAKARHQVVAHAGHGVMGLPCMSDVIYRFVDAESDDDALRVDTTCAAAIPRPPVFTSPAPADRARAR